MIKVLVFGTFDGLHEGHKDFLRQAKEQGEYLVVVVGRDSTVERIKKKLPKFNENQRLEVIQETKYVDFARLGNEGVPVYKIIKEIMPDVICLGYDQTHFTEKLEEEIKAMGLDIKIIRLKSFEPEKYKSSLLNK
ncbi:MAG: FAD synthase [Candidatus Staskawiczbacteria bacterium]|nr:FAD synthase [Candidatus Staskawiczbacteria bacterium]